MRDFIASASCRRLLKRHTIPKKWYWSVDVGLMRLATVCVTVSFVQGLQSVAISFDVVNGLSQI